METLLSWLPIIITTIIFIFLLLIAAFTIKQNTVGVITRFGKFNSIRRTGLNFKLPFIDTIYRIISLQNMTENLKFQAITIDQANVHFNVMLLYSVLNSEDETIKNVAFKFKTDQDFIMALSKTAEGSVRAFIAGKKQSEVLSIRSEIVNHVKSQMDTVLETWGYHIQDLQINDITFDQAIVESMSKVVASNNLKAAAENEGQALLITKTKAAEAEGNAIKIAAEAEKTAAQLRGQGVALFREEVAKGMSQAAEEMKKANLDTNVIMFSMWVESIKHFAEHGKGNVIFLDGSADGMDRNMKQIQSMLFNKDLKSVTISS